MFYLGVHEPAWLARVPGVPMFVSRRRLARRKRQPVAVTDWALDSGGFSELTMHGRWTIDANTYADEVRHYRDTIGRMQWAAPQDWMCEPSIVAHTGLTVDTHQRRTVDNYAELIDIAPDVAWIPVLQGHTLSDYLRHVDMYPFDLAECPTVGLGSVCRRQATAEIGAIVGALSARGLRLHGFGCKSQALRRYGRWMVSADSMAWSYSGSIRGTCVHKSTRCGDCLHWALSWRDDVIATPMGEWLQLALPFAEAV